MEVVGELRSEPHFQEGAAERVGVRRQLPVQRGREHESFVGNGGIPEGSEILRFRTDRPEGRDGPVCQHRLKLDPPAGITDSSSAGRLTASRPFRR